MAFSVSGDVNRDVTITFIGKDRASSAMRSISTQASSTSSRMTRLAGVMKKVAMVAATALAAAAAAAGYALYNLGKQAIESASNLNESINAVNVTFGKTADGILELSKSAAKNLGLAQSEFNGFAVQFANFARTVAGKRGDVVGTMDELTTRIADFASVMNLDVPEAAEKFQSALAGEIEPIRRFGIDVSAAAVEAYALKNGIASSAASMTEAQKVQARYALLMQQTAKVQGDFKNTSNELANSQRILSAQWENAKAKVGKALLPIMQELVNWARKEFIPWFRKEAIPAVQDLTKWLQENKDTVKSWGEALKAIGAALVVFVKAIGKVTGAIGALNRKVMEFLGLDFMSTSIQFKTALLILQNPLVIVREMVAQLLLVIRSLTAAIDAAIAKIGSLARAATTIPSGPAGFLGGLGGLVAGAFNADGGYLRRGIGGWTMVGEHGPELINNRGFVRPHSASMGAGGGNTYITVQGAVDPVMTARQIERILAKGRRVTGAGGLATA